LCRARGAPAGRLEEPGQGETPVKRVYREERRSVRRRFFVLFVSALVSAFGAVACGGGAEEQVQQRVEKELQEGQRQVEEQVREATQQVEQEAQEAKQRIRQEARQIQKQVEERVGEGQ
jgi:hypothetical protein